jgi:hypothetical protein
MTEQEQIKALAELDGWTEYLFGSANDCVKHKNCDWKIAPNYLASYDAIIPLIQKQNVTGSVIDNSPEDFHGYIIDMSPAQLCEALLKATGKWKE